jgi:hypothetical protein
MTAIEAVELASLLAANANPTKTPPYIVTPRDPTTPLTATTTPASTSSSKLRPQFFPPTPKMAEHSSSIIVKQPAGPSSSSSSSSSTSASGGDDDSGGIFNNNAAYDMERQVDFGGVARGTADPLAFCDNIIKTSRYTKWNFLPRNMFEQFNQMANVYFLCVGALQIIPELTTSDGIPTLYMPLAIILLVSALQAATEDYA